MSDIDQTYEHYVVVIGVQKDKLTQFVNGSDEEVVDTESGQLPTLARIVKAISERGGLAMHSSVGAGLASTIEGQFFKTPSPISDELDITYLHATGGVAEEKGRSVSSEFFKDTATGGASEHTEPNLFPDLALTDKSIYSYYGENLSLDTFNGRRCIVLRRGEGTPNGAASVDFPRDQFEQDVMSCSCYVESLEAGGSGTPRVLLIQYDESGSEVARETWNLGGGAINSALRVHFDGVAILPTTSLIRFYLDAATDKTGVFSRPFIGCGNSSGYRGAPLSTRRVEAIESEVGTLRADTANRIGGLMGNLAYLPRHFNTPRRINIEQDHNGGTVKVTPAYTQDVAGRSLTKTTYYVGFLGASDDNDGLSRASSIRSLSYLFNDLIGTPTTDVEIILGPGRYSNGIYPRHDAPVGVLWNHPFHLSMKAEGEVFLSTCEAFSLLAWVADGDAWMGTCPGVGHVFDAAVRDYRGLPIKLEQVESVADCQSQAGTWYFDGDNVWVHLHDGREPDFNTMVVRTAPGGSFWAVMQNSKEFYCENIKWCMYNHGTGDQDSMSVSTPVGEVGYATFRNCAFIGGYLNGLDMDRVSICYVDGCTAAYNGYDGFNYHDNINAPQSKVYEVNSHGYSNGQPDRGGTSHNGSTAHDGMTIFRANCVHYDNYGACIVDVNGCYSFNLNCWAGRSTRPSGATNAGFYFNDSVAVTPGETWLVGCGASDSEYDLSSDGIAKINVRGWRGGWNFNPNTIPERY
ncbi:hypothetical protein BN2364_1054 [Alloalcanivorax xenomutans]|uniref:hypothetical protein n=1 Tax=Alloalcanivorax xenomutans TaxID=1094342 RepID=UPI0006D5BCF3|nr:hypothetical protein [Alloalcanivorax xenomutans]CUR45495.1 hypothetical protein BN2364_1054 [Alloalcanivorax xenomutans]